MQLLRALWVALIVGAGSALAAGPDASATQALHALFDRSWQAGAELYPEWSTFRGDTRYNDRLADVSPAARARDIARTREELAAARAIAADRLAPTDRVSRDIFIRNHERRLALEAFEGYRMMGIGSNGGIQSDLSGLLRVVPMARVEHAEQLLRRLAAVPQRMDQEIANLRRGMALDYVPPRTVLERALAEIDAQLPADIEAGPFYAPFKRLGKEIGEAERARLQAAGRRAVETDVLPAMKKLRAFVAGDYLARAPAEGALLRYPDGVRLYDERCASRPPPT